MATPLLGKDKKSSWPPLLQRKKKKTTKQNQKKTIHGSFTERCSCAHLATKNCGFLTILSSVSVLHQDSWALRHPAQGS